MSENAIIELIIVGVLAISLLIVFFFIARIFLYEEGKYILSLENKEFYNEEDEIDDEINKDENLS